MDITTIHKYKVLKIWEIESNFIIDNNLYGLFPLLSLTKDCDLKTCYKKIESLNIDITKIKELYACAFLLAGLKYSKKLIKSLTKEEIMLESVTYKEILEKGIIKGKEEGIVQGREQDIVSVLNARFKKVPKSIAKKISAIDDLSLLEELLKVAATAKDLNEFKKHLTQL